MDRFIISFSFPNTALISCKRVYFDTFDGNDVKICAKQKFFNRSNSDSCNFGFASIFWEKFYRLLRDLLYPCDLSGRNNWMDCRGHVFVVRELQGEKQQVTILRILIPEWNNNQ